MGHIDWGNLSRRDLAEWVIIQLAEEGEITPLEKEGLIALPDVELYRELASMGWIWYPNNEMTPGGVYVKKG